MESNTSATYCIVRAYHGLFPRYFIDLAHHRHGIRLAKIEGVVRFKAFIGSLAFSLVLAGCGGGSSPSYRDLSGNGVLPTSPSATPSPSPESANVQPWSLFRVGIGGYASNGRSYCVFSSETHLNSCGYSTSEYTSAPQVSSPPSDQTDLGMCPCNANRPFQFRLFKDDPRCKDKAVAPIFILAGQSNAEGLGKISDLNGSEWFRNFWQTQSYAFKFSQDRNFSAWLDGSSLAAGRPYQNDRIFGPELELAALLQAGGWKNFYFFKFAVGGTSLGSDWKSRGDGGLYDQILRSLRAAANAICESGLQPDVRAFFWMQGESDANDGQHGIYYESNLTRLIDQVREDMTSPGTPFILGKIQTNSSILDTLGNLNVRAAQEKVTQIRLNVSALETQDLPRYSDACSTSNPFCTVHYNTQGILRLAQRFYSAFERMNGLPPSSGSSPDIRLSHPIYRLRSSVEHMWSTSPTGEGASKYGYTFEGRTFHLANALNTWANLPVYRLSKQVHVTAVSDAEKAYWISKGYRLEGILGYLASQPSQDLIPLHFWTRDDEARNPNYYSIQFLENEALLGLGYRYRGVIGYVPQSGERPSVPYKVGAYYFGMFGPNSVSATGSAFLPTASQFYSGSESPMDWWVGVRDLFLQRPFSQPQSSTLESFRQADWSHLKPAIGYYDQSKVSTLQAHIKQARQNGLSYFAFYWYWDFFKNNEVLSDGLKSFLAASNSSEMQFMLSLCQHGYQLSIKPSEQDRIAQILVSQYLSRSNYLKIANRPVIQLCATDGFLPRDPLVNSSGVISENLETYLNPTSPENVAGRVAQVQAFINRVNTLAQNSGIAVPLWTWRSDDGTLRSILSNSQYAYFKNSLSASQCILSYSNFADYADSASKTSTLNASLSAILGKQTMPCVAQNFDERPRMGVIKDPVASLNLGKISGYSESAFLASLLNIKDYMDARLSEDPFVSHLTLYAWNEWHEGGIIEPNAKEGARLLNLINEVFQLPQGSDPCRTTGRCF